MPLTSELQLSAPPGAAVGCLSNAGRKRYLMEVQSTTGCIAWKLPNGTTLVSNSLQVSLQESDWVAFWSCAGYQDTTPAGNITYLDCHGNDLVQADLSALTALQSLDLSFNELQELNLAGLTELVTLDVDHNRLTSLEVRHVTALRVLSCASNRLTSLDVAGLAALRVLDCSDNRLASLNTNGCSLLEETKCDGNPASI